MPKSPERLPTNLRRSALFMPASNQKALNKAFSLAHDVCIFDLEASVADGAKHIAREQLHALLNTQPTHNKEVVVRINQRHTHDYMRDITWLQTCTADAVLLPMVQTIEDIQTLADDMQAHNITAQIWAMIETPQAVLHIADICALKQPLRSFSCLVFGPNDLSLLTGTRQVAGRAPMLPWLMQCIVAARSYGLALLDGVYANIADTDGFEQECEQGVSIGMEGKTLIHPNQIAPCNAAFSPSETEVAQAQKIVDAFALPENAHLGALKVDGRMVERLHETIAQQLLAKHQAIQAILP